ncbi:MAG: response regulator transcription factor, partial [Nitriliruptorales bacterium]|nr:response regulator transcription factor [Nitriliruptorales bacterium]
PRAPMIDRLRVVVADDSVLLREGVASLLTETGMHVAATAADPHALLAHVDQYAPDVAIVDIRMPPTHTTEGLQAAKQIREASPKMAILLVSQYLETRYAVDLFGEDARGLGYLLKQRIHDIPQFVDAVRRVASGGCVVDP